VQVLGRVEGVETEVTGVETVPVIIYFFGFHVTNQWTSVTHVTQSLKVYNT
jgi:hypothetical protein